MSSPGYRRVSWDVDEIRSELGRLARELPRVEWDKRMTLLQRIWTLSGLLAKVDAHRPEPGTVPDVAMSA